MADMLEKDIPNLSALEELIACILINHELHGHQIIRAFDQASKGRRKLKAGSVYTTLARMELKQLLTSRGGIGRERYYKATDLARTAIATTQEVRANILNWKPQVQAHGDSL